MTSEVCPIQANNFTTTEGRRCWNLLWLVYK